MARNRTHKIIYWVQKHRMFCSLAHKLTSADTQMPNEIRTLHDARLEQIARERLSHLGNARVS